jgi:hypothetical protein
MKKKMIKPIIAKITRAIQIKMKEFCFARKAIVFNNRAAEVKPPPILSSLK